MQLKTIASRHKVSDRGVGGLASIYDIALSFHDNGIDQCICRSANSWSSNGDRLYCRAHPA